MEKIDSIFYKIMNPGDLWNIDRADGTVIGGGGQTYIDLGGIDDESIQDFLQYGTATDKDGDYKDRKIIIIDAYEIGNPDIKQSITFDPRPNRPNYRITNQHKYRHNAWSPSSGFPEIPPGATGASSVTNIPDLVIYIVRTINKEYYVGYVNQSMIPPNWPEGFSLQGFFTGERRGFIKYNREISIPDDVARVLGGLEENPNVLLYGPPGTGKTHTLQWIWKHINDGVEESKLMLNPNSKDSPFAEEVTSNPLYKFQNTRLEWVTFHQNFSYEDFVLGLRPKTTSMGMNLEPKLGILMDIVASIQNGEHDSAIIFIDELNRGNVARIFGQLITFLEYDKRDKDQYGVNNEYKLPMPIPELIIENDKTQSVIRMNGEEYKFDCPIYFPYPIYIIASMNSVDKAVAPLDTALSRRFTKIEYNPDYKFLQLYLDIDENKIDMDNKTTWTAKETAYLLLKRVNNFIELVVGPEFQLGHSYILKIAVCEDEESAFRALYDIWENSIFPIVAERLSNRKELLINLLNVEQANISSMSWYPYKYKKSSILLDGYGDGYVLEKGSVYYRDIDIIADTLRMLASNE